MACGRHASSTPLRVPVCAPHPGKTPDAHSPRHTAPHKVPGRMKVSGCNLYSKCPGVCKVGGTVGPGPDTDHTPRRAVTRPPPPHTQRERHTPTASRLDRRERRGRLPRRAPSDAPASAGRPARRSAALSTFFFLPHVFCMGVGAPLVTTVGDHDASVSSPVFCMGVGAPLVSAVLPPPCILYGRTIHFLCRGDKSPTVVTWWAAPRWGAGGIVRQRLLQSSRHSLGYQLYINVDM